MASEIRPAAGLAEQAGFVGHETAVLERVYGFVEIHFQDPKFDSSHDFAHVVRVAKNALLIFNQEKHARPLDVITVLMGALLHDVEDKKYAEPSINDWSQILLILTNSGFSLQEAERIKKLVDGVSYSSEVKDPARVQRLIEEIPELAVVQDADRLDAIGAIGIARCFTFGGAKDVRSLEESVQHFRDKLLKLPGMMKTETGKKMAAERSERLQQFMSWWEDEVGVPDPRMCPS